MVEYLSEVVSFVPVERCLKIRLANLFPRNSAQWAVLWKLSIKSVCLMSASIWNLKELPVDFQALLERTFLKIRHQVTLASPQIRRGMLSSLLADE
jgi:glucose dehydrogenase